MRMMLIALIALVGLTANAQTNKGKPQLQGSNGLCRSNQEQAQIKLGIAMGIPMGSDSKEVLGAAVEKMSKKEFSPQVMMVIQNAVDFAKLSKRAMALQLAKSQKAAKDGFQRKLLQVVHDEKATEVELLIVAGDLVLVIAKKMQEGKEFTEAEKNELITKVAPLMQSVEHAAQFKKDAFNAVSKLGKAELVALKKMIVNYNNEAMIGVCEAGFKRFLN